MTGLRQSLPAADEELWDLVGALVDGTATAAERDRLDRRLHAEPAARAFYVAFLDLHAQLQWRTRGEAAPRARARWLSPRYRLAAAACLALTAGLLAALLARRHGPEDGELPDLPDTPAGSVAVLIDSPQTVWDRDTTLPTETGSPLPPGRLKLKAGVVAVAFHGGGEVLLEGPADLDVRAPDRAYLRRGKLTATVPEGAAFRVGMPGVEVTDRGGECGLLREDSGRTEVHVFTGLVDADPTDGQGDPLPAVRLGERKGARVDAARGTLTPVPLNEGAFAHLRPEIRVSDASVRDGAYAGHNFGTAPRLAVKNSIPGYSSESYLRFDLSGVKGKVTEARVRLMPVRVGMPLVNAAALVPDNLWSETALTWDTRPASGAAFTTWTVNAGRPIEFDVTRFVREALAADKMLSLRIFAPELVRGNSVVVYGSRRGDAEARPRLLVKVETP